MPLPFHKMHANGDDFVIVAARKMANPVTSALVRRMGVRNRGIVFNQMEYAVGCWTLALKWNVAAVRSRWNGMA